ncbi:MAG: RagB/SusD family nutrient uptake outer membrane protein [Bacteroidetes bacterium]|nr:RagB/SusD family nutrient uptake outer membrane protein [Fibrella sp.]
MQVIKFSSLMTALTVGLLLTGCGSRLDIQPVNTISNTNALATSADVEAALIGAYDGLGDDDLYGGNLLRDAELIGDNSGEVLFQGTFGEVRQVYRRLITNDNGQASRTWLEAYQTINICNTVLDNLAKVDMSRRDNVEGQAKFIRGSLLFELVRFYARPWGDGDNNANLGVPIVLRSTTVIDASANVPRSPVAAVYTQVIQDLTEAEAKLLPTNGFFATKAAAAAQLSRVYLQQGAYPNAAAAANRVIVSNRYSLAGNVEEAFDLRVFVNGINTDETIFALQVTDQDGTNSLNTFYASAQLGGRGSDIIINDRHLNLYDAADLRGELFYIDENDYTRTAKFINTYGNVQIFRLAEMYLTRAEANFRAATTTGAAPLADVNLIRARAGLPPLTAAQLTLAAILRERRLELAFEGTLIHDLKRNRTSTQYTSTVFPWNSPRLIYPIPLREIQANPALIQNVGY